MHRGHHLKPRASSPPIRLGEIVRRHTPPCALFDALEQVGSRHAECLRQVTESLIQKPAPTELNIDDDVPGYTRFERELLLRHTFFDAQFDNASAYSTPPSLPYLYSFGIVLTGAGRHVLKLSGRNAGRSHLVSPSASRRGAAPPSSGHYSIPSTRSEAATSSSMAISIKHSKVTPRFPLSTASRTPAERPTRWPNSSRLRPRCSRKRVMREPT